MVPYTKENLIKILTKSGGQILNYNALCKSQLLNNLQISHQISGALASLHLFYQSVTMRVNLPYDRVVKILLNYVSTIGL